MKLLHTADLHLGRLFHGRDLIEDHAAVLDQIADAVCKHRPDVLIIAGDIYDRAAPPASAVSQFNAFIRRIFSETTTAIVMIAGNHDSGDRIGSMAALADSRRALVRGPLMSEEPPLILNDDHGPVAFSGLPFGNEFAARECFADTTIATPADVLGAQIAAARRYVPESARWVVVAHAFVTGADPSESERKLVVGGVETAPADLFDRANYVALGHLHRPQIVGSGHIRYSGSPIAFGFDEADTPKSMVLVDLKSDGTVETTLLPFQPVHRLRILRGALADLLAHSESSADFVKVILTDATRQIDPMSRIREIYENAVVLGYARDEIKLETKSASLAQTAMADPLHVIGEFLARVEPDGQTVEDQRLIKSGLAALAHRESTS